MRISDWSSDVCSSDLCDGTIGAIADALEPKAYSSRAFIREMGRYLAEHGKKDNSLVKLAYEHDVPIFCPAFVDSSAGFGLVKHQVERMKEDKPRSEEHTSELQSLMRISYAVFCLKKKQQKTTKKSTNSTYIK